MDVLIFVLGPCEALVPLLVIPVARGDAVGAVAIAGVFGVATTASAEKGKKVFEASVGELVKHIEYVKKLSAEDLLPKSCV